jgi:hypothetical protein
VRTFFLSLVPRLPKIRVQVEEVKVKPTSSSHRDRDKLFTIERKPALPEDSKPATGPGLYGPRERPRRRTPAETKALADKYIKGK